MKNSVKNTQIISDYFINKLCKTHNLSKMLVDNDHIFLSSSILNGNEENYGIALYRIKNGNFRLKIFNDGKVGFECVLNPNNNPNRWGNTQMVEVNIKSNKDIYYYMDSFYNDRKTLCKR